VPLLAETSPALDPEALEPLLAPALDILAMVGVDEASLQGFAQAWDRGEVTPLALLPGGNATGALLAPEAWTFLGCGGLRPALESYFADCRPSLTEGAWQRGVCPFCGGAPGFTDILENGGRRLVCHFCGGGWIFPRLRCPSCDTADTKQFVKIQGEDKEEGYLISACRACRAYLKELDRRVRWNAGTALVEDWGSPHLDVFAHRSGYWRAVPTLIELEQATRARA
jgi:FdhE protein